MDWARGGTDPAYFERPDGVVGPGAGHEFYLAASRAWPSAERGALRHVRGRVIDLGTGAGRVPLHLQERGFDVVAVDLSKRAIEAARLRGVRKAWCMSAHEVKGELKEFDTIVLFGNNFGMFGGPDHVRRTLADWARLTHPGTRILAESTDPYGGGAPCLDRRYYRRNKSLGRAPGHIRLRTRYRERVGPWSDWLFVSRRDMRALLRGTGWHVQKTYGGLPSEPFVAVLEKS